MKILKLFSVLLLVCCLISFLPGFVPKQADQIRNALCRLRPAGYALILLLFLAALAAQGYAPFVYFQF